MTIEQTLPITAMLEESFKEKTDDFPEYSYSGIREVILPQVRTLEESQQKKAKEEERERIAGILEEMKANSFHKDARDKLQEAITRITN